MKKKRIDQILKSAFGELDGALGQLTDAERSELEKMRKVQEGLTALKDVPECQLSNERLHAAILASMTHVERSEHEKMRTVYDGMRALKDVPECQLSNERLRDAILSNAVRPRRISAWTVATASVACVAIALIALRGMGGPEPGERVVINDPAPSFGTDNASAILGDQSKIFGTTDRGSNEPVTNDATGATRTVTPTETKATGPDFHGAKSDFGNVISNPGLGQDPDVAITAVSLSGSAERATVVVVDPDSVTRNGAAKATEMDSYKDVVFGG